MCKYISLKVSKRTSNRKEGLRCEHWFVMSGNKTKWYKMFGSGASDDAFKKY